MGMSQICLGGPGKPLFAQEDILRIEVASGTATLYVFLRRPDKTLQPFINMLQILLRHCSGLAISWQKLVVLMHIYI